MTRANRVKTRMKTTAAGTYDPAQSKVGEVDADGEREDGTAQSDEGEVRTEGQAPYMLDMMDTTIEVDDSVMRDRNTSEDSDKSDAEDASMADNTKTDQGKVHDVESEAGEDGDDSDDSLSDSRYASPAANNDNDELMEYGSLSDAGEHREDVDDGPSESLPKDVDASTDNDEAMEDDDAGEDEAGDQPSGSQLAVARKGTSKASKQLLGSHVADTEESTPGEDGHTDPQKNRIISPHRPQSGLR